MRSDLKSRANSALAQLLHQQRDSLHRYFQRRTAHNWDAQDLVQETCARVLAADRERPSAIRNPEAYLYTIASNLLKTRAAQSQQMQSDSEAANHVDEALTTPCQAMAAADQAQRRERLTRVLARLPERQRDILMLRYRDELDYRQIAAQLGISTHMVKKYVVKALAACRQGMLPYD